MIENVKHIYYRGLLSSCNYTCSYCPFAKTPFNCKEMEKDKDCLENFCAFIESTTFQDNISISFVPYGEALIHDYYIHAMARLASLSIVSYVSCQTNLSFDETAFIHRLELLQVDLTKIKLWATYHPEMVTQDTFVAKVEKLKEKMDLSIGVVAIPQELEPIIQLRKSLPKDIYLWINGKAREKTRYSKSEIRSLLEIDPLFDNELSRHKVEMDCCYGGITSVFIEANGDVFPCNINKNRLYNIYKTAASSSPFQCDRRICDCYLAYSNRKDFNGKKYFHSYIPVRIPWKRNIQGIFLDIDGTLTSETGMIDQKAIEQIQFLKDKAKIYLATSLPFPIAIKKCNPIKKYIMGGVFANGSQVLDWGFNYSEIVPLEKEVLNLVSSIPKLSIYRQDNSIYKVLLRKKHLPSDLESLPQITLTHEGEHISIHSSHASKLLGIQKICSLNHFTEDQVLVMGNSSNDLEMIRSFKHSVAVMHTHEKLVQESASYHLNIDHLAMFFK